MTVRTWDNPGGSGHDPPDWRTPTADILVAGLPGPLLRWTASLLGGAMAARHTSVAHLSMGQTQWTPPGPDAVARLFVGDFVSDAWAATLSDGLIPAVLVIDDEAAVWAEIDDTLRETNEVVARHLVAVGTALGDLVGRDNILILRPAAFSDPAAAVARVIAHVGLPAESFDNVVARLSAGGAGPPPWAMPPSPQLPASARALIDAVVSPAFQYGCAGTRLAVTWPRDCLFWGDQPGTRLPRILDMTGPARVIAYGPYFALPCGRWTIRTTLAVSPASRGAPLALELHGANQLGRFAFSVDRPGLFAATFVVTVPSSREPLEFRLVTERGAIEGTLGIDRIDLTPDPA
jgi:hypothetical protein